MSKPRLRIKGYTGDWKEEKADLIFRSVSDKGHPELPVLSATQDRGMVIRDDSEKLVIHDKRNEVGYKRVVPGQFVIHLRSFQGGFAHSDVEGITSPAYTVMEFKEPEKHNDYFWKYVFSSREFVNRLRVVTYGIRDGRSISYEDFLGLSMTFPSAEEQADIAGLIKLMGNQITNLTDKITSLKSLKICYLSRLFPIGGGQEPAIRLAEFSGKWEEKKLGDIADKVTEKNTAHQVDEVFTNSAVHGVISQRDFFDHDVAKKANTGGYYVVSKNDFVYNPRISVTSPVGPINRNRTGRKGVMSPLYTVFRTHDVNPVFLEHYFKSTAWHKYMRFNGNTGARFDRFSITNEDFFNMPIPLPSPEEQAKIADYFENLDSLIKHHEEELERLKSLKQSCLQGMFI